MVRIKKGRIAHRRRKRLLQHTKGFKWARRKKFRWAKQALLKAWPYAYRDRKRKKREFRSLWQIQINAACRQLGITYGQFIHGLKQKKIEIDRKILAELAKNHPEIFKEIVEKVKPQIK